MMNLHIEYTINWVGGLGTGRVSEYDVPIRLLENKNSLFAKLVIEYSLRSTSCHS
jgi:hypothetical protein